MRDILSTKMPLLSGSILLIGSLPHPLLAKDFSKGQKVFEKFRACHTTNGKHRMGPTLKNIFLDGGGECKRLLKIFKRLEEC